MFTVINDGLVYGKYFERYSTQFKEPNYLKSGMKQKLLINGLCFMYFKFMKKWGFHTTILQKVIIK